MDLSKYVRRGFPRSNSGVKVSIDAAKALHEKFLAEHPELREYIEKKRDAIETDEEKS